jgi:hypothetical protein
MIHTSTTSCLTALTLFTALFAFSSPNDIDSTQSSIDFAQLVATPSTKVIHFKWDVNAESKGDHFIIEKSTDKASWKSISRVESIGNHRSRHTYTVSEINLAESAHEYFRIKRIDKLGNEAVLDVVDINQPILTSLILIPGSKSANKQLIISYTSLINSGGIVTVFNMDGQAVFEQRVNLKSGYNRVLVDTHKYEKGNYIVVLRDEFDNRLTKSFVLQTNKERKSKF